MTVWLDKMKIKFSRKGVEPERPKPQQSHLMDLLDISLGATTISSPTPNDPWGMSSGRPQVSLSFRLSTLS